jgi:hypothetical protein
VTVNPGDTFYFDPKDENKPHLWVVLHVYLDDYGTHCAIVVSITTWTNVSWADPACILEPENCDGHPFIYNKSYVFYREALKCETSDLSRLNPPKSYGPVSPEVLRRIRAGAHTSKHTKRGLKTKLPKP